jgi:hypothetical protein
VKDRNNVAAVFQLGGGELQIDLRAGHRSEPFMDEE